VATKYEFYNPVVNNTILTSATVWRAQTFTITTAHTITSIKLYISNSGAANSGCAYHIRATTAGAPSGGDLASGTVADGSLLAAPGEVVTVSLGAGALLNIGTYAICIEGVNQLINSDQGTPTYAGGSRWNSVDSGANWSEQTNDDFYFEEWGDPVASSGAKSMVQKILQIGVF
jgi:hypothetical protein